MHACANIVRSPQGVASAVAIQGVAWAMSHDGSMSRALSSLEYALLARFFEDPRPGVEAARVQLESARHAGPSHDGEDQCFDIEVVGDVPLIDLPDGPHFGAIVFEDGEPTGDIGVWVSDGRLSSFEYSWFSADPPARLPSLDQSIEPPPAEDRRRSRGWKLPFFRR